MASLLRRLSIPFKDSSETQATDATPTESSPQRRKSSFSIPVVERTLGARDYKLGVEEQETQARRASVTSDLGYETNTTEVTMDDATKGRIYGARDYKLIPTRKLSA